MTDFPWFPLYIDDWARATSEFTDEQAGAYMRLLCYAWGQNGLPADEKKIRAIGRWSPAAWRRIWTMVGPKWVQQGDRLVNLRQESERAGTEVRSAAGRAAAAKRWHSGRNAIASATAEPTQCYPQVQVHPQGTSGEISLSEPRAGAFDRSTGQIAAAGVGLIGAWNNLAAGEPPSPFAWLTVTAPPNHRLILDALRARPEIDWWADVFRKVVASDVLRGRAPWRSTREVKAVDFWFVLKHAEQIAAGQYDNSTKRRQAPSDPVPEWQAHCTHKPPCVVVTQCETAWAWVKAQETAEATA